MSEQGNPVPILQYAGPRRDPLAPEVYAQGTDLLVVRHGAALPKRCIICNGEPRGAAKRVRLRWVAREAGESLGYERSVPLIGPFLMVGSLIELLIRGRVATIEVSVCSMHRWRHFVKWIAWWLYLLAGPLLIWAGVAVRSPLLVLLGIVALACTASIAHPPRLLRTVLIDDEHVVAIGAGAAFRAELPHWS